MTIIQVIISAPAEIAYAVSSATALAAITIKVMYQQKKTPIQVLKVSLRIKVTVSQKSDLIQHAI